MYDLEQQHADMEALRTMQHESFIENLPPLYRAMTFAAFGTRDVESVDNARSRALAWVNDYQKMKAGLYLTSQQRGTGKTHLALAIGHAMSARGVPVKVLDVVSLLSQIRNGFEEHKPRIDVERLGAAAPILILDDLGAEKQSVWVSEQLYLLINSAIKSETTLIITSNLDYKALAAKMDDRIVSRIIGATDMVRMDGPDYRLEMYRERMDERKEQR